MWCASCASSILYFTSFVDADGTIQFRDDIYGRDKRLRAALDGTLPASTVNIKAKSGRHLEFQLPA